MKNCFILHGHVCVVFKVIGVGSEKVIFGGGSGLRLNDGFDVKLEIVG